MPLISVIVPVFKTEKYLKRCVDSILAQTFGDFDLFLIDDGSPDRSGEILDGYALSDGRVKLIHQSNSGASAARNVGIRRSFEESDSRWLTFIDSDDYVRQDYLALLLDLAERNRVRIASAAFDRFSAELPGEVAYKKREKVVTPDGLYELDRDFYRVNGITSTNRLYDRELFRETRFPPGKLYEDVYIMHELIFRCDRLAITNEILYYYFDNPESIRNLPWSPRLLDGVDAAERRLAFFEERGAENAIQFGVLGYYVQLMNCCRRITKEQKNNDTFLPILRIKLQKLLQAYGRSGLFTAEEYREACRFAWPSLNGSAQESERQA